MSASFNLLVVVGATGSQGRAVVQWFQQYEPSWKIRGLTRNPSSEAAQALAKTGIEVVKADLNDLESVKAAFKDAKAIFAYTDFGGIVQSDEVMGRLQRGELQPPIGQHSYPIELKHGTNIADAAATVPGLERLVWSALSNVIKWSKGKYIHGYHFDVKAEITAYMFAKPELKGKVSTVQMGPFANNPLTFTQQFGYFKGGEKEIVWRLPMKVDDKMPWVDVEADIGAFVRALIDAPAGTQLLGSSEELSNKQWMELFNKYNSSGLTMRYEQISDKEYLGEDPVGFNEEILEMLQYMQEFGFAGGDPQIITPAELQQKGIKLQTTPIAEHVKRTNWAKLEEAVQV